MLMVLPFCLGAFAFFGPGKFNTMYQSLTVPAADGHLHFAGEALSTRHAWVEGAFDSAWRAVFGLLLQPGFTKAQRKKFFKNWGTNAEWWTPESSVLREGGGWGGQDEKMDVDEMLKESLFVKHLATAPARELVV